MAAAAMERFEQAKNVAYWDNTRVCDAFYEKSAWKVRLNAGFLLYKFHGYASLTNSTKVSPWWSAYHEYDVGSSLMQRLKLADMNGVSLEELARVTSAIVTEWNTIDYIAVIKLDVPVFAWYGGFSSMPRFQRHLPPAPPARFDATTGLREFSAEEKEKFVAARNRAPGDPVPEGALTDWEAEFYLKRWENLYREGVTQGNMPTKDEIKYTGSVTPGTPAARLPDVPAPPEAARGGLSRGGPPERGRHQRLPGGSRQFYIPNLTTSNVTLLHIRDTRDWSTRRSPEAWWAAGHNGTDTKGAALQGEHKPPG